MDNDCDQINEMEKLISKVCCDIETLLISKNKSYGNAALSPVNIFSKATVIDQIDARIDDKLKRIKNGVEYDKEDTELDLIGYLILKRVLKIKHKKDFENKIRYKYQKNIKEKKEEVIFNGKPYKLEDIGLEYKKMIPKKNVEKNDNKKIYSSLKEDVEIFKLGFKKNIF